MTVLDWFGVFCGMVFLACITLDAATNFALVRFRFYLLAMFAFALGGAIP